MTPAQRVEALEGFAVLADEMLAHGRELVADGRDPFEAAAEVIATAKPVAIAATAAISLAHALAPPSAPTSSSGLAIH